MAVSAAVEMILMQVHGRCYVYELEMLTSMFLFIGHKVLAWTFNGSSLPLSLSLLAWWHVLIHRWFAFIYYWAWKGCVQLDNSKLQTTTFILFKCSLSESQRSAIYCPVPHSKEPLRSLKRHRKRLKAVKCARKPPAPVNRDSCTTTIKWCQRPERCKETKRRHKMTTEMQNDICVSFSLGILLLCRKGEGEVKGCFFFVTLNRQCYC